MKLKYYSLLGKSKFLLIAVLFFSIVGNIYAQPTWLTNPYTNNVTAISFDLIFELSGANNNAYITLYRGDYTTLSAATVKAASGWGDVPGTRWGQQFIGITGPQTATFENIIPNTTYTILIVAETSGGLLQATPYVIYPFKTPSCPSIFVETGLNNTDRCVNGDGATKIYTFNTKDGDFFAGSDAGIIKGATWTIDWGDGGGSNLFHTSTYNNDGPGGILVPGWEFGQISHTYNTHEDCFYVASFQIQNPGVCSSTGSQSETKIPILHGRDIDIDGNGDFVIDEVGTGVTDTIYLCEGYEYTTSIEDISTWDCQPDIYYPSDPPGSPSGEANEQPRFLQWVYGGASPDASLEATANTITGSVVIGGLGAVSSGGPGVIGDTVKTANPILNQSAPITIPATCQEGEMFKIYYKNWNKCNPFAGTHYNNSNYIEAEIVILIIHAPDPPIAPDPVYCESAIGNLTASPTEGGTLTWYSDAVLTTVVGTGGTFNHGQTTPGIYTYYVTESLAVCEGPPTEVILTITPEITNNVLNDNGESFCAAGDPSPIDGETPGGGDGDLSDDIQWQISTNGGSTWTDIPGATSEDYNPIAIVSTTMYRRNISSGNCASTSNVITIVVHLLASATNPPNRSICDANNVHNGNTTFNVTVSGAARTIQWQRSSNGGATWVDITGGAAPNDNCTYANYTTDILSISSADYPMNGYQYRVKLTTTAGGCVTFSNAGILTVRPTPDITDQPDNTTICEFTNTTFQVLASIASGSITGYQWQYENLDINGGNNPEGAYSGETTNTLVVTGPSRALDNKRHRAIVTSNLGCQTYTNNALLYINPLADITTHPQPREICVNGNTSFTVVTDGSPVVSAYQWQVSTNGGGTWNAPVGGVYSGQNSQTLNLANVPQGANGNLYRVILTSPGGCDIISNTALLTVNPEPTEKVITSAANNICYNTSTNVQINNSEAGVTYSVYNAAGDILIGSVNGNGGGTVTVNTGNLTNASYTYYVIARNITTTCERRNTDEVTISVNPRFQLAQLHDNQSICSGFSANFFVTLTGGTAPYNLTYSDGTTNFNVPNYNSNGVLNTGVLGSTTVYNVVSVTDANGCPVENLGTAITITVGSLPTAAILSGGSNICVGTNTSLRVNVAGGAPPYTIVFDNALLGTQVTATAITDFPLNGLAVNTYNFSIVSVTDNCGNTVPGAGISGNPQTIVVNALPNAAGTTNNDPTICNNTATSITLAANIPGSTFTWNVVDANGAGAANGTGNIGDVIGQTLTNGTNNPIFVIYQIVPRGPAPTNCPGAQVDRTVQIEPIPQAVITNNTAAVCNNANVNVTITSPTNPTVPGDLTFDMIVTSTNGGALGGTASVNIIGGSFPRNINGTLTNSSNTVITVTYTVTPKLSGCVNGPVKTTTINVEPTPQAAISTTTPTVCAGANVNVQITSPTVPSVPANLVFDLVVTSTNGGALGGTASVNLNNQGFPRTINGTLTNSSNAPITVTYTITPQLAGCSDGPTKAVNVVVEPTPQAVLNNTTPKVCNGSNISIAVTSPTTPSVPANLYFNVAVTSTDPGNLAGTASSGFSNQAFPHTINGTLINNSNDDITVTYTITPMIAGCAAGPVKVTTVVVEPTPVALISNTTPGICEGGAVNIAITSPTVPSVPANLTFDLVVTSTNDGALGGTASVDRPGESFPRTLNGTLTNSSNAPITVTFTVTPMLSGCANGVNKVTTVVVEPDPVAAIVNTTPTVCNGSNVNVVITSPTNPTVPGNLLFDLVVTSTNGAALGGTASGNLSNQAFPRTINGTLTNSSNVAITVTYTVTPKLSGCANGTLAVTTVIVEPTPRAVLNNLDAVICQGGNINIQVTSPTVPSVPANLSFDVVVTSTDDANLGGSASLDLTGQAFPRTLNGTLTNVSDADILVTYTITPKLLGCAVGPNQVTTVTVEPRPRAVITNNATTICQGGNVDLVISSPTVPSVPGDLGFNLAVTSTNPGALGGTASVNLGGQSFPQSLGGTLTNSSNAFITVTYTVTPTLNGCANGPVAVTTVIVEPTPQTTIANSTPVICNGSNVNLPIVSPTNPSVPANLVFDLVVTSTNAGAMGGTAWGNQVNLAFPYTVNGTLTNSSNADVTVTFRVTPKLSGCASGPFKTTTVVLEPTPVATVTNTTPAICNTEHVNITVNSPTAPSVAGNLTFDVVVTSTNDPSLGGTASFDLNNVSAGHLINGDLTNSSNAPITVTYTVTPKLAGCASGTPVPTTVIVYPKPNVIPTNNNPVFPTGDATDILLNGNVAGTTFGWRVLNPGASGAFDDGGVPIGGSITQTLINASAAPISVTYRIGPAANGCLGDSVDVSVQIDPNVDMTVVNNAPFLCTGGLTDIDISGSVAGTMFSWVVLNAGATGATAGSGGPNTHTIQQPLTNLTTAAVTVTYRITPTGPPPTNIVGTSQDINVTVYPTPLALITNHAPRICNGTATSIEFNSDVLGTTFTWTVTDPTGGLSGASGSAGSSPIGAYIAQTLTNSGTLPFTVTYHILPTGSGGVACPGAIVDINVIVDPTPVANPNNVAPIICSDEFTDITLQASVIGSTFTYTVVDPKGTGAVGGTGVIGDVISQQLFNITQTPVTITYAITPFGPGATACPGATEFENVTVNPLPITSAIAGIDTVCEGTPNLVFSVVHTADSYYEWNIPAVLGSPTFGGSGLNSYAVIVLAANTPVQVTDSIWVFETNKYGCARDTIYHPMTVIPIPIQQNITGDAPVCALTTHTYSVPDNPGSTYQWFIPPGAGFASADPTIHTVDVTFGMISGQVRVIETSAGGCVTTHLPLPLTVNQLPISTINADRIAACLGDLINFTAGPAGGLNYEFFVNGISVQTGPSNLFSSTGILNGNQVTVNVTSAAGCERLSNPLSITIYDPPVVTLTSSDADNIICFGENVAFTGTSATAVNYNFFLNGVSQQSGPLNFWPTISLLDGDAVHVEVLSGFGCWGSSDTLTTLVNDLPVAELGSDKDICPGDFIDLAVNITVGVGPYEVTIDNGVPVLSGYNSGDPIPVSPPFTTTYNLVSVTDANLCTSAILTPSSGNLSGSATVTVFDSVQILTQPNNAMVCEGIDATFTVGAIGETVMYQWESTQDLASGFTLIGGATAATWAVIAPGAALDSTWYRVRVYSATCPEEAYSDTVQLVLKYDPALAGHPAGQTVCEGDGTGFAVDAGLTFNPVFDWLVSYDNGSSWLMLGDSAVYNGTTTDSLRVSSASSRFNGYQYKAVVTGECGTPIESNPAVLMINERPEILEHPSDTTVCEGLPVSFRMDAGVTTSVAYAWQVDMGPGFVALGDTAGVYSGTATAELNVLNPVSSYNGYEYRVVVSGACPATLTSNPALLLVSENPEITTQPVDVVICENESPLITVNAGVTSGAVYAWEVSYDLGGSWLDLADTAIYTGTATGTLRLMGVPSSNDGNLYHVIVSGVCTPAVTSANVSLTVRERPEIISQPADRVVCEGVMAQFDVDAGVTSGVAYQWQVNMGSGFVNLGDTAGIYAGATSASLQVLVPGSRFDGYQYRVRVTGDCTPMQVSNTVTLTVQELPEVTLQPVARTICEEQNTFFTMSSGVTTAPSYLWQVDMGGGFVDIGADTGVYSGSGTPNLFLSLVPSGFDGYIYHAVVSGVCAPDAVTNDVLLTVRQNPEILADPVNDTICEGDPAIYTVNAGVTTGVTYQWQVNRVGLWQNISNGADYAGTTTSQLTVNAPVSSYNGYLYRAIVGGTCNPPVTSAQALLVVHERPEIIAHPSDKAVCEDGDTYFVVRSGNTTLPAILWEYSVNGVTWDPASSLAGVNDDSNDTLFVTGIPSGYNNYRFRATVSGQCPLPVTSNPAILTVYQKPEILIQPADVTDCEQDTVMFFTDAGVTTNPVYQWEIWNGAAWTIPPPDIYAGVNNDTMYINGIHSGIDQLQVRLRLGGICTPGQVSDTAVLTVDERPEVTSHPDDLTICENDSATFEVSAGVTTAPVYTWEYFDGTLWQSATGGFFEGEDTETLRLYGATGVPSTWTGTQFRAIISNGCGPNDTSDVATLVVNQRPVILSQPMDAVTCEGISTSYTIDPGVTAFPSYLWQVHNGVSWMAVTGVQYSGQGTQTLTILNPTSNMNGFGYRVILSGACDPLLVSDSVSLTVQENPEIILQPGNAAICEGSDTTFVIHAGVTTNPLYEWFYNDNVNGWQSVTADGIHSGFNTSTLSITGALFTMDNWMYRVVVTGDCGSPETSQTARLVVYKLPEILSQPSDTTTCELRNVAFSVNVGNTDAPFLQWEEFNGTTWSVLSDGGNYIGVNTNLLKVYTVDSSMTGFRYRVRVMGQCDPEVLSDEAVLTVQSAPDIWLQPVDATICEGDPASFTMTSTGTAISYFWQVDNGTGSGFVDITDSNAGVYSGWNSNTLDLTGADRTFNFNKYRIRVSGACAPVAISDLAILFVQTPAEIQNQPQPKTICEFENAVFSVSATGLGLAYQWQESRDNGSTWDDLSDVGLYIGSQSPTLSIFAVERGANGYIYRVVITGSCGLPVTSDEIILTVETAPEILRQPVAITACENTPAGFGVEAQGTNIVYRWQLNQGGGFANIADTDARFTGAGSDTLTLLSAQLSQAGYSFRVIISGNCPSAATTSPVILLVNANPVINTQPVSAAICEDGTTLFGADASGAELQYQWYVDRQDGAGFVVLTDDAVHLGSNTDQVQLTSTPVSQDGWQYRLHVFNACTATQSGVVTLTVWPNPVPAITPAQPGNFPNYPQICGGDLLTLDGSPSSGSGNYTLHQWSGAIGPLSAINTQVVDFMTVVKGDYNLAYTVTDDRGCKGSDVVTIINDRPDAQFVSNAVPSCGYMEVDFTNTSSADAVTFEWDFDDGITSAQKHITHGFDNLDITGQVAYYNITMVASSINGCNDTALSVVTIYPKVVAEIDADPTEGCHPLQVTLISQPGGSGYRWDFGDGSQPQDGSYIAYHLFENFGTAVKVNTVSLTTTSAYGCSDTKTVDVIVQPIPQPNFTAVPLVQTYPDATVGFTNTTQTGPWSFLWNFGDNLTSTEESPTHIYAAPGTFDVSFHVMNGACEDSSKTTVVINPRLPIAAFAEPMGGCNPVEVQFVNQSQWATTYLWDFGDGYVSTRENPEHTFYDIGTFTIRLQVTGPGGTDYASWTIDIWESPNVAFNSSPDSVFVKDKPVRFYNLSAGATNYAWDFGDYYEDGTAAPGNFSNAADTSHIYFTEGYKDVTLVGWNEHCSDSITLMAVKVIPKGELQFPTVFRPDPGGPNGGYIDPNDPSVDPNYANSIFFPGVNKQVSEYHLFIYNRWGEQIFQSDDINIGWDGYLHGELAAQGVYFWKVNVVYKNGAPDTSRGDITLLHKKQQ